VPRHDTTRAVLQEMRAMKKSRIGRRFLRRRSRDEIDGLPSPRGCSASGAFRATSAIERALTAPELQRLRPRRTSSAEVAVVVSVCQSQGALTK
jgi:hypothetical protein